MCLLSCRLGKKEIVSSNENVGVFPFFSVDKIKEIVQAELLNMFSFIIPHCN